MNDLFEKIKGTLHGVKIVRHYSEKAGVSSSNRECIYYKKGLTNELRSKYSWYFEYRRSLEQVKTPRFKVELISWSYQPESEEEQLLHKKRVIASAKAQVTKKDKRCKELKEAIRKYEEWYKANHLFASEMNKNPEYRKALSELEKAEQKLIDAKEYLTLKMKL